MSINTDMKKYILQEKVTVEAPSGAEKIEWKDKREIYLAIYKMKGNPFYNIDTIRYSQSTHSGITFFRDIKAYKNRIKDKLTGRIYEIEDVAIRRRVILTLKVVEQDV